MQVRRAGRATRVRVGSRTHDEPEAAEHNSACEVTFASWRVFVLSGRRTCFLPRVVIAPTAAPFRRYCRTLAQATGIQYRALAQPGSQA